MVKILINNASILTFSSAKKLLIKEGYIFSNEGRIYAVGDGEPPEEFSYPELLINGKDKLVLPAFSSAYTIASLYPLRYVIKDLDLSKNLDYLKKLSRTDMYFLAAMTIIEMISKGITNALFIDIYLDEVARVAHDSGFNVVLAPPINCGLEEFEPENELKLLINRWHEKVDEVKVALATCGKPTEEVLEIVRTYGLKLFVLNAPYVDVEDPNVVYINPMNGSGSNVIRWGPQLSMWQPNEGLGIGVRPSYSMIDVSREVVYKTGRHPIDIIYAITTRNPNILGFKSLGPIEDNYKTNLLMFNTSEPPGWPLPTEINSLTKAIVEGELRIETLIIDDEILLDNAETLTLGREVISKAKKRLSSIIQEYVESLTTTLQ